jgi:hypothetical protein
MNKTKDMWERTNEVLRLNNIDRDQRQHINCIRIHPTESDEHFTWKVNKSRELFKSGHPFLTECFADCRKRRFDIIDLEDNIIYEGETTNIQKPGDNVKTERIVKP